MPYVEYNCWPMPPIPIARDLLAGAIAIAGIIFTIVMLIDCLKRKKTDFPHPITNKADYDKIIWATAIIISLWYYFLGTIVYFFVVKKTKQKKEVLKKQKINHSRFRKISARHTTVANNI